MGKNLTPNSQPPPCVLKSRHLIKNYNTLQFRFTDMERLIMLILPVFQASGCSLTDSLASGLGPQAGIAYWPASHTQILLSWPHFSITFLNIVFQTQVINSALNERLAGQQATIAFPKYCQVGLILLVVFHASGAPLADRMAQGPGPWHGQQSESKAHHSLQTHSLC